MRRLTMAEYIDGIKTTERDVPDTNVGDLISRQAALNELPHANWGKEWDEALAKAIIESLPTIDPVKHGKWISVPFKENRICSICEGDEPYKFADENADIFDYCPHCGARMDGGEDDTEG